MNDGNNNNNPENVEGMAGQGQRLGPTASEQGQASQYTYAPAPPGYAAQTPYTPYQQASYPPYHYQNPPIGYAPPQYHAPPISPGTPHQDPHQGGTGHPPRQNDPIHSWPPQNQGAPMPNWPCQGHNYYNPYMGNPGYPSREPYYPPPNNNPPSQHHNGLSSFFDIRDERFLKGALVGAAVTFLLTNDSVQKNAIKSIVKVWSMFQGGLEEVKERFRDADAEIKAEEIHK